MKKNFFKTMGKTLMIACLGIGLVTFSNCTKDPENPTPNPVNPTPDPENPTPNPSPAGGTFNGHDYVDLGLPSGTLWATCNVGALTPEEYGDYYAWGEISTKTTYSWGTYQYCKGSYREITKYCGTEYWGYQGFTDTLSVLLPSDDAATVKWGSGWCMPTKAQWDELLGNVTTRYTTQNEVRGMLLTSSNGNSIFLPGAGCYWNDELLYHQSGCYWSSSLRTDQSSTASYYNFGSNFSIVGPQDRSRGKSIRPVLSTR